METKLSSQSLAKFPDLVLPEWSPNETERLNGFRDRVKTYINSHLWGSQQAWLFPTICAQYGWKCVTSQLLQCETCRSNVSPAAPNHHNFDLHQKCVQNTLEKLKTSHKKHCPWPLTPCPNHYIRIYPMHKEEAYLMFVKRLRCLYTLQEQLPCIKDGVMAKLGLTNDMCSSLCKVSFHVENDYSQSAVLLAATGWSKDVDSESKKKLQCLSCQRSIALFLYTCIASSKSESSNVPVPKSEDSNETNSSHTLKNGSSKESKDVVDDNKCATDDCTSVQKSISDNSSTDKDPNLPSDTGDTKAGTNISSENVNTNTENQSPPPKRKKFAVVTESFDPLYEHRSWCPWLIESGYHTESQDHSLTHTINIPGWQLFIKCLLRNTKHVVCNSNMQNTPLKDQIKYARHMLESWNSPEKL